MALKTGLGCLCFSCSFWLSKWNCKQARSTLVVKKLNQFRPIFLLSGVSVSHARSLWKADLPRALDSEDLTRNLKEVGLGVSRGAKSWPGGREQGVGAGAQLAREATQCYVCCGYSCPFHAQAFCEDTECTDNIVANSKLELLTDSKKVGDHILKNKIVVNETAKHDPIWKHLPSKAQRNIRHYQHEKMV